MPLAKQLIPVDLGGGLDTKTAPVLVQPGRAAAPGLAGNAGGFLELENCFRQRTGEFVKRYGSTVLAANNAGATPGGSTLGRLGSTLVQIIVGNNLSASWQYNPSAAAWSAPLSILDGAVCPVTRPLISPSLVDTFDPDVAVTGNYMIAAYEQTGAGITAVPIDNQTGQPVYIGQNVAAGSRAKAAAVTGFLCVFYATTTNDLKALVFATTNVNTIQTPTIYTIAAGTLNATPFFDVRPRDGATTIILAWRVAAGGVTFGEFNPATGLLTTGPTNIAGVDANQCLGWLEDRFATGAYYLASAGTTSGIVVRTISTAFAATATNTMDGTATANVRNVTGFLTTAGANMRVFWEISAANTYDYFVRVADWTGASSVSVFMRSVGLISKPILYGASAANPYYLTVGYESSSQATHFLVRANPAQGNPVVIAPVSYGSAGGHTTRPSMLACGYNPSGATAYTAMSSRIQIIASNGTFRTVRNVRPLEFRFEESGVIGPPKEIGGGMWYAGGILKLFDGSYGAIRPTLAPEAVVPTNTGAGNLTAASTYQWSATYKITDNAGRIYRSSPSTAVSATTVGAAAFSVTVPTYRIPTVFAFAGTPSYHPITLELWQTLANGTVSYKVGEALNDPTVDTVAIVANTSDANLSTAELLYTTGGVIDDFDAPASTVVEVFGGRLWAVSSEDRTRVFYSKELLPGLGVAFRPDTFIRLDQADGDVFALGILDDKLIFFKRSTIYSLSGPGPNALGQGGYDTPTLLTNAQGCINPRSVVVTPDGVMFEAQRGIWLLDRSGALQYIGAGVDAYFTGGGRDVSVGVHMPWRSQVRFFTAAGRTLVYDYQARQWGTFTGQPAATAVTIGTTVYWAHPTTNIVSQEVEGSYGDNGTGYAQKITTPHLAFAGIAGFQRVYASLLVGENVGTHTLSVAVELNYSGSAAFTRTLAGATAWPRPEVRWDVQRCESGKLTISESAANVNAGFKLSALSLLVGVMPNSSRRPATGRLT